VIESWRACITQLSSWLIGRGLTLIQPSPPSFHPLNSIIQTPSAKQEGCRVFHLRETARSSSGGGGSGREDEKTPMWHWLPFSDDRLSRPLESCMHTGCLHTRSKASSAGLIYSIGHYHLSPWPWSQLRTRHFAKSADSVRARISQICGFRARMHSAYSVK
jgi:hypothetical protein